MGENKYDLDRAYEINGPEEARRHYGGWAETYEQFIERVRAHRGGRWAPVKVADILANLSDSPTPAQIRKYAKALLVLVPENTNNTPCA